MGGTREGKVVEYACMEGYKLKGNAHRTCLSTGEWSGSIPRCRSKLASSDWNAMDP